ncbi:Iron-sulfur cluster repair protein DnrN [Kingella potus]|uniref:Iron-sulfur cluster repair protein DnrN n=1 Tax=Kingella potus TaxID=265175 RepID=A0A377QZ66_9NEIS|nr:hemerythrin domain-containing protein [Kingella potus]UOP01552.1 hemerythrin domain-containing protein [Kingella potus]STR00159.1 Iron-sulfur cluster repair protein DnrN [Kingella potus]
MTDLTPWQTAPLHDITAHIVPRYHNTHRSQLAEMIGRGTVLAETESGFPEDFVPTVQAIQNELLSHMMKEERILFPMIENGAGSGAAMPIRMMMHEHGDHRGAIGLLAAVTNQFTPPEHAGGEWRQLYTIARQFADDLAEHIELEDNILFARTLSV